MGMIIPIAWLDRELPEDATDADDALTNAITQASAFCNTWAVNYLEWDAYSAGPITELENYGSSSSASSSSEDADSEGYVINAPSEIARICLEVSKVMYFMGRGQIYREGTEQVEWRDILNSYKEELKTIQIEPTKHTLAISLDTSGYQLIARNKNILTHNAYITSNARNNWNLGVHFQIIKGNLIDVDDYHSDGWYLDGSTYSSTLEGTLHYFRSYRKDSKDYMKTWRSDFSNT